MADYSNRISFINHSKAKPTLNIFEKEGFQAGKLILSVANNRNAQQRPINMSLVSRNAAHLYFTWIRTQVITRGKKKYLYKKWEKTDNGLMVNVHVNINSYINNVRDYVKIFIL